jgi:putative restriction endonuclease
MDSSFAPEQGYRYDGLYWVDEYWQETGKSGFKVWQYRLRKNDNSSGPSPKPGIEPPKSPERREFTTTRIVRDSEMSRRIKQLYDFTCQICGTRLETPAGLYAEGAHIKPLGIPHNGPDVDSNLLCLCPNHHVLFDDGAIALTNDFSVLGMKSTKLTIKHPIEIEYVRYHREHFGTLIRKMA